MAKKKTTKKKVSAKKSKKVKKFITFDQISQLEHAAWVIQIGTEYMVHEGAIAFNKDEAIGLYGKLRLGLSHVIESGKPAERKKAINDISNLKVVPLRIH